MLNFRMNMPLSYMAFYGSILIVIILFMRCLLKNKLPKFVFPILWTAVLIRLLVPFSLSSPLSFTPIELPFSNLNPWNEATAVEIAEDSSQTTETATGTADHAPVITEAVTSNVSNITEEAVTVTEDIQAGHIFYNHAYFPLFISAEHLLPALYFSGLLLTVGILLYQKYGYTKKLRNSLLMEHNELVNSTLRELNAGELLVFTNDEIASPLASGLLNPRIYLPTRMDFGNKGMLRHILAHEVIHIRRKDNWLKAVMVIALCLNWYNPLVWIMSRCLCSDLEDACDAAVLKTYDKEQQKEYAFSLLAMAITGNRTSLLYSAFSKTEVERRIKGILQYKKASFLTLLVSVLFLSCGIIACATGGQAPFAPDLSSYCASANSRWGVKAYLTRDIALEKNPRSRSNQVILDILSTDDTNDPDIFTEKIRNALAKEFGVEKTAFRVEYNLCLDDEAIEKEYEPFGLVHDENGHWIYQGEAVHVYYDKLLGNYQSREDGTIDVTVERDRLGQVVSVTPHPKGEVRFTEY